jgi:hypothetical protein
MSRIITRTAAAAVAAAALLSVAAPAQAATAPTKADRAAVKVANRICAPVTDDYAFEACVIGEFAQQTGRILTYRDYAIDGKVKLTGRSHRHVTRTHHVAPTSKDKAAMNRANDVAENAVDPEFDAQWLDTLKGDFILQRGRFIDEDMLARNKYGRVVLTEHSIRAAK